MHPAECWVTPPKMGAVTGCALLPASIPCQESQPVQRPAHDVFTSAACPGPDAPSVPLLQATSPAIPSPYVPAELDTSSAIKAAIDSRSPASPGAAYAPCTLGVLTVSQPKAVAAIMMPSCACAWLCCALDRLHVLKHCRGC